ncbi:MAG: anthranilate phosphoribosyltransferase [Lentisphaeria bacterium]|nr:anthranilate phosphoribosyltransferase [Lentisphaeria bacterium]
MLNEALKKVVAGGSLTEQESADMVNAIAVGENNIAAAGLLTAMSMRGETVSEMTGAANFLRDRMIAVNAGDCSDIVGTGGDGGKSFNISTASALVAAGAGVRMAKHGNRAVSGKCGAADVLEELGVRLDGGADALATSVRDNGIAFLFARSLHPVMAKAAPLRRDLGSRTIFNLVGPLANPAHAVYMVVGVYHERLLMPFAQVLRNLGVKRGLVVHSADGLDEISSLAPTAAAILSEDGIRETVIRPEEILDDPALRTGSLAGGDRTENAKILLDVLSGRDHTAKRGAVLLNAAAICAASGLGETIRDCIPLAEKSIDSGAALEKLGRLRA